MKTILLRVPWNGKSGLPLRHCLAIKSILEQMFSQPIQFWLPNWPTVGTIGYRWITSQAVMWGSSSQSCFSNSRVSSQEILQLCEAVTQLLSEKSLSYIVPKTFSFQSVTKLSHFHRKFLNVLIVQTLSCKFRKPLLLRFYILK